MNDFFSLFDAMLSGPAPVIKRSELGNFIVSTVNTVDCGPETAIVDNKGAHPVQRYNTVEEAERGHEEWVKKIKNDGVRKVQELGYGSLVDPKDITLVELS